MKKASPGSILVEAGFTRDDMLVVGVSGGPDSLALLHKMLSSVPAGSLHVAHLDHAMRPSSAADAHYVASIARDWGLAFHSERIDVPSLVDEHSWSPEEAAREARYRFLARVAQNVDAKYVAVGHNADDQAETVLMHLLRGSGLSGLRGMLAVSPFPGVRDLTLIRPLLQVSRTEVEAYCTEHDLAPLVDESNIDQTFLRNRIRHDLLPQLAAYNPRIKSQLIQLASIAAAEDAVLEDQVSAIWSELVVQIGPACLFLDRRCFNELPLAVRRRAIRRASSILIPDLSDFSFKTVEQAVDIAGRAESGIEVMLPGGLKLFSDYETLVVTSSQDDLPSELPQLLTAEIISLPIPGKIDLANGWTLTAEPVEQLPEDINPQNDPWLAYVDIGQQDVLTVRARREGERLQPLGMHGRSSSLQDIMVNRKLAARLRAKWPLVVADDHPVWLVGHTIDQRVAVSDNSRRVVILRCERAGDAT